MVAKIIGGKYCKVIIGATSYHLTSGCSYPLVGAKPKAIAAVQVASNTWRSAIYAYAQLVASRAGDNDLYMEFSNNYDRG